MKRPSLLGLLVLACGLSMHAAARGSAPKITATLFDLVQVRLLDGPFKQAQALDLNYLLSLNPDRLLVMFRSTAGVSMDGLSSDDVSPPGGWESPASELRGHSMGHHLSACALMYAGTSTGRSR